MNHRLSSVILMVLSFCLLTAGCVQKKSEPTEKAAEKGKSAVEAAEAWLAGVDAGNYSESWDATSKYFQGVVKRDQLVQQLSAVRKPMGDMVSRHLQSSTCQTSMPGAPDGNYVVILFETEFTQKKSGVETVCMVEDSGWKVSGYYIK